jgi:bile acid:Na+ symporter, BASS family
MPSPQSLQNSSLAGALRRFLPILLLACYLFAVMLPGPGAWLHRLSLPSGVPDVLNPGLPQLIVAILLFLAALGAELHRVPLVVRHPVRLVIALVAVWLIPLLLVIPLRWVLPLAMPDDVAIATMLGFALVAAMPVANSSAAWTQHARGELPWGLALVVLSILLCPLVTPAALGLLGLTFTPGESQALAELMESFSGVKFVIWVLIPTAAGIVLRRFVGPDRVAAYRQLVLAASAALLLLLNYINASVALPQMQSRVEFGWFALIGFVAILNCLAGLLGARLIGASTRAPQEVVIALDYALMMKNTGLALALASDVLGDRDFVVLPLFAATLVQHLVAAWHHARVQARREQAAAEQAYSGSSAAADS